jgi:hypothetical protein
VLVALMAMTAGCHTAQPIGQTATYSEDMVRLWYTESIEAAIVREGTLYSHHFVTDRPELNELGLRDLRVLARHLNSVGGEIRVSSGGAAEELYQARQDHVRQALADMGVNTSRLVVSDGIPGGDGIESDRAMSIVEGMNGGANTDGAAAPDISIETGSISD